MARVERDQGRVSKRVTVNYCGRPIAGNVGCRLLDVLLDSGVDHRHICGGRGFCTSCRIEVLSGATHLSGVSAVERQRLGREAGRLRLACQTIVLGDASVRVPRAQSSLYSPFEPSDNDTQDTDGPAA